MFVLKNVNDTIFGLDRADSLPKSDSNNNLNTSNGDVKLNGNLKNKLKMFEFNYELKFTNKESKYSGFSLLNYCLIYKLVHVYMYLFFNLI